MKNLIHDTGNTRIWQGEVPDDNPFTLGHWIVFAPWMHMAWNYHYLSLIHVRDVEGHPPAVMQFEEATHEFQVLAISPDNEPTNFTEITPLMPVSIAQQFVAENDAEALELIELQLPHIAAGELSVDSDYRSVWHHILREHKLADFKF